jgi:hypothetical protein
MNERFNEKTKEFKDNHIREIEALKQQFLNSFKKLEEKNSTLTKENLDLKNWLGQRPSRDEDLDEINRLNLEIEKKERELKENSVLLEQFRNELINREETYNGYFDRKPKIGFVDPIKVKKENDKKKLKAINNQKK